MIRQNRMFSWRLMVGLAALSVACSDNAVTATVGDGGGMDASVDAVSDTQPESDTVGATDTPEVDTAEPDAGQPSTCEPGEGCFGEPCDGNDDCLSGICSMHLGEKVCSKTCDESCPEGWECTLVGAGGDGQYVCISSFTSLCLPCETSEGCAGEPPAACVKYGDGTSFCGGACDENTPCPTGYDCSEVESINGATSFQCVNTAGECPCSSLAVESTLSTPCEVTNDMGTCAGIRICEAEGLSACSANEATEEVCNGVDDDCNGAVDDGTCDDGNPCTVDGCAGADGCVYEPVVDGACSDGDACTASDVCVDGVCVGTPVECGDDNPCTVDSCGEDGECVFEPVVLACDDGDPCTLGDLCTDGTCQGTATLPCDDNNPCTDDACGEQGCVHNPTEGSCDDANACTQEDSCQEGACVGKQVICEDGNLCTTETCDVGLGCMSTENNQPCDDGNVCTVGDACTGGSCVPGATNLVCDDGNPCTNDSCDTVAGCVFENNAADCDDGNACTETSACSGGVCVGSQALDCDDNNLCTADGCEPGTGCVYTNLEVACTDEDPCTVGDACQGGVCTAGPNALPCEDGNVCTDDSCEPGLGCAFTPNQAACDDGNACTVDEACNQGGCQSNAMLECDDGNLCTDDSCQPATGCVHGANVLPCDDGNLCSVGDACSGGSCQPGKGALACDDGIFCNGEESCDAGQGCVSGQPPEVDDNVDCTLDACDEEAGMVTNTPVHALCEGSTACSVVSCDPSQGCLDTIEPNCCGNGVQEDGELCDDGNDVDGDGCNAQCKTEVKVSCKDWLSQDPALADGVYSITPPGSEPLDVYCDMTTNGGGWTLVAKISASDQNDRWGYDAAIYKDESVLGDPLNLSKNDAKSKAYGSVAGNQVLIRHLGADHWAVHTYSPDGSSWGGYINSIWNGCGVEVSGGADALKDDGRDGLIGNKLYFRHYDVQVGNCSSQERSMMAEVPHNAGWTEVGVGLTEGNATYLDAQSGPAGAANTGNNVGTQHDDYGFFVR